jgi:uncharacterized protein
VDPDAPLQALRTRYALKLTFDRSVGGSVAAFLEGLALGELRGSRDGGGRVHVPPLEEGEIVRVADAGEVRAWSWVSQPEASQPLDRPFAYALIQLDGADTSWLHVVDVPAESDMRQGMRVRADWRLDRQGSVLDVRAFVPGPSSEGPPRGEVGELHVVNDRVMEYTFEPGLALSGFYRALGERRIEGGRCGSCQRVFVPPHDHCPTCGSGPMTRVQLSDTGTIVSFTVVHLPMPGLPVEVPFAWARIRLDGADVPFPHVVRGVDPESVRVGDRVQATWAEDGERETSWEAIRWFRTIAT